ncbi:hypothetical protein L596_022510 [Steinernema carpocapsae]|uniref:Uncharacterized protein n=1 Tax=Steinernema carpocapsae TaxID=34508 RepID=A0A4U5MLZ1_STECR|nr:hypothetical protein L596_022510 [Steinernema carpocapsae]
MFVRPSKVEIAQRKLFLKGSLASPPCTSTSPVFALSPKIENAFVLNPKKIPQSAQDSFKNSEICQISQAKNERSNSKIVYFKTKKGHLIAT